MVTVRRVGEGLGRWWELSRRYYLVDLLARTVQEFTRRRSTTYAAALSYYVLLSFFPLLIFIVALLGLVLRDPEAQESVTTSLLQALPAGLDLQENTENVLREVGRTNHSLVGIAALLATGWSASTMFTALRRALNVALDIPDHTSFIRNKARDLAGVVGTLLFLLAMVAALVVVLFVVALGLVLGQMVLPHEVIEILPLGIAGRLFFLTLSFLVSFVSVLMVYLIVPDRRLRLRELWPGAALAAAGFEAAKFGFGLYVSTYGRFQEIYGALGNAVAFLAFVFLVANIVLFAAVLVSVRRRDRGTGSPAPASGCGP
jgi:membrane protein